ncbi:MAG: FecR domain-containing protein [Polyangia bacterium]
MSRSELEAAALMHRCLDGTASSHDIEALDRLLRTGGPAVGHSVARTVRFEGMLEEAVRTGTSGVPEMPELVSLAPRPWLRFAGGICGAAGLCAVLSVACFWVFAARSPHRPTLHVADAPPSFRAPSPHAVPPRAPPRRLEIADGSVVTLRDGQTVLAVESVSATQVVVGLSRGQAYFDVARRPERRFRVRAGTVEVEVLGTAFTVDRSTPGAVAVTVDRGVVRVTSPAGERLLRAGDEGLFQEGVALAAIDASPRTPRRVVPASPSGAPSVPLGRRTGAPRSEDTAKALLKTAVDARAVGSPAEAAIALRTIVDRWPGDPRAPYAAFMLGRVLLDDLNRPLEAAQTFASVLRLDPTTPLAEDALAREIEAWSRAGRAALVRERARSFLSQFPNGLHAEEIRAIVDVR